MIRLYVVVEGQTEESFVTRMLGPHLAGLQIFVTPILVTTNRDRLTGRKVGRGGGHWKHWRKDIRRLFLDGAPEVRVTTLFDLYGLRYRQHRREKRGGRVATCSATRSG